MRSSLAVALQRWTRRRSGLVVSAAAVVLAVVLVALPTRMPTGAAAQETTITFAVIGDFGSGNANEQEVATLVKSWNPDFIITVGDNNYPDGEAATMDANVGKFYHEYMHPYSGSFGAGASENRFWPSVGNRDYENTVGLPLQPYLNYFTLPGNERYYD
ncbi:MAG TPA: hypothetical protein VGV59_10215, partial [Pyrinomonadaceae bacterium]|nr:hypothetical protein [Pyrinomonadaceae bacterium]